MNKSASAFGSQPPMDPGNEVMQRYSFNSSGLHENSSETKILLKDVSKTSTHLEEKWSHVSGAEVRDTDLLLGRGIGKDHPGNIRFKNLISLYKYEYLAAPKPLKPRVAAKVVTAWRDIGGRFLERKGGDKKKNMRSKDGVNILKTDWFDVGDKRAREKASMSLRERTPEALSYLQMMKENRQDSPVGPSPSSIKKGDCLLPSPPTSAHKLLPPPRNILLDTIHEESEHKIPPFSDSALFVGLKTPIMKAPRDFCPQTRVEALQHAEIQEIKNSMIEQQKQIEDLKKQLASFNHSSSKAAAESSNDCVGAQGTTTPHVGTTANTGDLRSNEIVKPSLLVSPVPYLDVHKQYVESPMAAIPTSVFQGCFSSDTVAPLSSDEEAMLAPTPLRPRRSLFINDAIAPAEQAAFSQGTTPLKLDSTLAWLKWTPEKFAFGVQSPLISTPLSSTPKKKRGAIPSIPALKRVSCSPEFAALKRRSNKRVAELDDLAYPEMQRAYPSCHVDKKLKMKHFDSTQNMAYASMTSV